MSLPYLNAKKMATAVIVKRGAKTTEVAPEQSEPGAEGPSPDLMALAESLLKAIDERSAGDIAKILSTIIDE